MRCNIKEARGDCLHAALSMTATLMLKFWFNNICNCSVIGVSAVLIWFPCPLLRNGDLQLCKIWQWLLQYKLQRQVEDHKETFSKWLFCFWWLLYPWDNKYSASEILQSECCLDFWFYILHWNQICMCLIIKDVYVQEIITDLLLNKLYLVAIVFTIKAIVSVVQFGFF